MEGAPVLEVVDAPLDADDAFLGSQPLPDALPVLPLRDTVAFPGRCGSSSRGCSG